MIISNLNIKLIEDRLGFIIESLVHLRRLGSLSEEEFFKGDTPAASEESYLRRSLEALFDIGRHIIAKTAGKGIIEYKEIANALGEREVVSKDLSTRLVQMAGYRNRLVHFYHKVTEQELYRIIRERLGDIEKFVEEIKDFLKAYRRSLQ